MKKISLRICLWTDLDIPAGPRLFKLQPHPNIHFSFPCTKEGMAEAKDSAQKLENYINTSTK